MFCNGSTAELHSQFCEIINEPHLSIFRGSAGPKPLKISHSLTMAEFYVENFALCGEECLMLAHRSVVEQAVFCNRYVHKSYECWQ